MYMAKFMGEITCTWFPKTLANNLNFMGEMTCAWFPKTLGLSLHLAKSFIIVYCQ